MRSTGQSGWPEYDWSVNGFIAPQSGTNYVRVSGGRNVQYALAVSRNAQQLPSPFMFAGDWDLTAGRPAISSLGVDSGMAYRISTSDFQLQLLMRERSGIIKQWDTLTLRRNYLLRRKQSLKVHPCQNLSLLFLL
jgi:hypothetical protein